MQLCTFKGADSHPSCYTLLLMAAGKRLYFSPSTENAQYLRQLAKLGIYGKSRGQIVNLILGKEIMQLVKDGILEKLPGSEPEDED